MELTKTYTYPDERKIMIEYFPNDNFSRKIITYYDENERILKEESYDSDGHLMSTTHMNYENEYILREVVKKNDEVTRIRYSEKNNMGDILKQASIFFVESDESRTMFHLFHNIYNENMQLVKRTEYLTNAIEGDVLESIYFE